LTGDLKRDPISAAKRDRLVYTTAVTEAIKEADIKKAKL